MPFCTQCGTEVTPQASYCHVCGAKQQAARRQASAAQMTDRTASMLCYIPVFGVIPAIVFLAMQSYRTNAKVRFDAFQSLYLWVAYLLVSSVLGPFAGFGFEHHVLVHLLVGPLKAFLFLVWVYLLIKAAQGHQVQLPLIGELAERSASEQL